MTERSIAAYDVSQRVKTYDADMELMHPNRSKMVQVAIEVLPFPRTAALRAIDLGIGTGYFTKQFLNHFPNSQVLGVDGAEAMVDLAKARLTSLASRVQFVVGDFRNLQQMAPGAGMADVVFSAYALHHLGSLVCFSGRSRDVFIISSWPSSSSGTKPRPPHVGH